MSIDADFIWKYSSENFMWIIYFPQLQIKEKYFRNVLVIKMENLRDM